MQKLSEEFIQIYKENPELIFPAEYASYKLLEIKLKEFHAEKYCKELTIKLDKLWKLARSYWVFPEYGDVLKMIDEAYKKNPL